MRMRMVLTAAWNAFRRRNRSRSRWLPEQFQGQVDAGAAGLAPEDDQAVIQAGTNPLSCNGYSQRVDDVAHLAAGPPGIIVYGLLQGGRVVRLGLCQQLVE